MEGTFEKFITGERAVQNSSTLKYDLKPKQHHKPNPIQTLNVLKLWSKQWAFIGFQEDGRRKQMFKHCLTLRGETENANIDNMFKNDSG